MSDRHPDVKLAATIWIWCLGIALAGGALGAASTQCGCTPDTTRRAKMAAETADYGLCLDRCDETTTTCQANADCIAECDKAAGLKAPTVVCVGDGGAE